MITTAIVLAALVFIMGGYWYLRNVRLFNDHTFRVFIIAWLFNAMLFGFLFWNELYILIICYAVACLVADWLNIRKLRKNNK